MEKSSNISVLPSVFKAEGFVFGNYWGGGKGFYPAEVFEADNYDELLKTIKQAFDDGSIDSGMGYESLIGSLLTITEVKRIEYDNLIYTHPSTSNLLLGDWDDVLFVESPHY